MGRTISRTESRSYSVFFGPTRTARIQLHDEGWTARLNDHGIVEWQPPPQANGKPGTNNFFHPQRYLPDNQDDP